MGALGSTAVHRSLLEILEESGLFFRDGDTICDANVHALIRASSLAVAPRALARQVIRFSTLSTIGLFVAGVHRSIRILYRAALIFTPTGLNCSSRDVQPAVQPALRSQLRSQMLSTQ